MSGAIRPQTLEDYIGQERVKRRLKISLISSKRQQKPLPHTILYGPAGTGKTSMAAVIANEMGTRLHVYNSTAITSLDDLVNILAVIEPLDVLFIDEIHRLSIQVEEALYEAMEDFMFTSQHGRAWIHPFTLVGATTLLGNISKPMRDRFGLQFLLELYTPVELSVLLVRRAHKMGAELTPEAAGEIAMRSRGVARVAISYLERCYDMAVYKGSNTITHEIALETFDLMGIDERGLTERDYEYLKVLYERERPMGVNAIASVLNESAGAIEDMIEPYLLQIGLVERGSRGRQITDKGKAIIENSRGEMSIV